MLVGGFNPFNPSEKCLAVGMMKFPIYGKQKNMFQTTNQNVIPRYTTISSVQLLTASPIGPTDLFPLEVCYRLILSGVGKAYSSPWDIVNSSQITCLWEEKWCSLI